MHKPNFYIFYQIFKKGKTSGQIVVLITLVVAIAFIFLAVVMNLSQISQNKLLLTLAANNGVINLASMCSSSAAYMKYSSLAGGGYTGPHGEWEKCGYSGSAASFLGILVGVVLAIFTGGTALALIIGFVASVGSFLLQSYVIEPAQVNAWNKEMKNLSRDQQFTESAMRAAFLQSVNDDEEIPDTYDTDMDGRTDDYVSRFGEWYRQRLVGLREPLGDLEHQIFLFLCPAPNSLADFSGYTADFLTSYGTLLCSGSYVYHPAFSEFMGVDDYIVTGATPNPLDATGVFKLFYDINSAGVFSTGAARPDPYNYVIDFWKAGTVACPEGIDCSYPEDDDVDALLENIEYFNNWSVGFYKDIDIDETGQHHPDADGSHSYEFIPGILKMQMESLVSEYNVWFRQELYNPSAPDGTWYAVTQQWRNWLNSWAASLNVTKTNMTTEKTFLETVFGQITQLRNQQNTYRAWINLFNARIAGLNNLARDIVNLIHQRGEISTQRAAIEAQIRALGCDPNTTSQPWSCCASAPIRNVCLIQVGRLITQYNALTAQLNDLTNQINHKWTLYYNNQCVLATNLNNSPCASQTLPCNQHHDYRADAQACIATLNSQIAALGTQISALWDQVRALLCAPGAVCSEAQLIILAEARINQLTDLIGRISPTTDKFSEFVGKINGLQQKIVTLSNFNPNINPNFSDHYSWSDGEGLWHHVKVDIAAPCQYPWIKSRMTGTFREDKCFYITKDRGWLGVKVNRYDQSKAQEMKFGSGQSLWRFIFFHPEQGESSNPADWRESLPHGVSSFACAKFGAEAGNLNFSSCPVNAIFGQCHND